MRGTEALVGRAQTPQTSGWQEGHALPCNLLHRRCLILPVPVTSTSCPSVRTRPCFLRAVVRASI